MLYTKKLSALSTKQISQETSTEARAPHQKDNHVTFVG